MPDTDFTPALDAERQARAQALGHARALEAMDAEIKRLRAALAVCGAPFDTGPTTIAGAAQIIAAEFERRMNYAANTLNDGMVPTPTTFGE